MIKNTESEVSLRTSATPTGLIACSSSTVKNDFDRTPGTSRNCVESRVDLTRNWKPCAKRHEAMPLKIARAQALRGSTEVDGFRTGFRSKNDCTSEGSRTKS